MPDMLPITVDEQRHRFEYTENGYTAFIEYQLADNSIAFLHTIVPESLGGRGIAAALSRFAFDYALQNNLPVVVYCPYIQSYLKKHPELNTQLAQPS